MNVCCSPGKAWVRTASMQAWTVLPMVSFKSYDRGGWAT